MSKLRVGVVGVGHIGKNHARLYAEQSVAEFTAIFDTDTARAQQLAAEFGVVAATSLEDLAARVDAASIATPTSSHFEVARTLLEKGKHLLVEKPITENPAHATSLAQLAAQRRLILQVGHVERFNPVLSALEERLTHPRFIEAHRLSPYPNRSTDIGVVLDLMIHDLEIILHLVRSPVETIDAVGVPVLSRSEDIANARLRFENGCIANITSSRISPERMRKIRVFQEDAYLSLDYQNQTGEIYRRSLTGITKEAVEIERGEPLKQQLASFIECAATGRAPKVSGFQATAALELAVEITQRIESGGKAAGRVTSFGAVGEAHAHTRSLHFVAGEASGDAHGAALMSELRKRAPDLRLTGRGGPRMRAEAGPEFLDWSKDSAVLGLWEVLKHYPYFRAQFRVTLSQIAREKPDAVVLIDYPGFNLRLASALRAQHPRLKIIYYISPQVWAWNRRRIPQMARCLDLMLCIFPFEADLYNQSGLRTVFVGHPLVRSLTAPPASAVRDPDLIGLFPGSRLREVGKILPTMLRAAYLIAAARPQTRFEISLASPALARAVEARAGRWTLSTEQLRITTGAATDLMQRAQVGIVASGTATLEAAKFRLPFVLVYRVAWLTYIAARMVVKVKHLGMPNVLAGREVVPEFVQHWARARPIANAVMRLMEEGAPRSGLIAEFDRIIASLGQEGARITAAEAVLHEIGAAGAPAGGP